MINNFTTCYLICLHCYFSVTKCISIFIHLVIPKSNIHTHRSILHLNIRLNYNIIISEFLLEIKEAARPCENIRPINISA